MSPVRLAKQIVGWVLVVAGLAALVLPGPGLLLLAGGLAVLSQQYAWAERRLEPVKAKGLEGARASVRSRASIATSVLFGLFLIGCGITWGLRPPVPGFWPVHERWWLPGGWATGSTMILSGLIVLGLLIYSYRRFGRPRADFPDQPQTSGASS